MVKNLEQLRERYESARKTETVDIGPPWGEIAVAELSAKSMLELLKLWQRAGLVRVEQDPSGDTKVKVMVTDETLDVDTAYGAFLETTIQAAITDEGRQLFVGKEGRELAEKIPLEGLGEITSAVMRLAGAEENEDDSGN